LLQELTGEKQSKHPLLTDTWPAWNRQGKLRPEPAPISAGV